MNPNILGDGGREALITNSENTERAVKGLIGTRIRVDIIAVRLFYF